MIMRIEHAIVVHIDFDDDIYFENQGTFVFTDKDEVIDFVQIALEVINTKRKYFSEVDINTYDWVSGFIWCGGRQFGNWTIDVQFTSDKVHEWFDSPYADDCFF